MKVTPGAASTVEFQSDMTALSPQEGGIWQIADRPFPAFNSGIEDLMFDGLLASGSVGPGRADFTLDIDAAAAESATAAPNMLHVRVLPLKRKAGAQFGGAPSNTVRVLYNVSVPPPPDFSFVEIDTDPLGLFEIEITNFTPATFEDRNRWGCVTVVGHNFEGRSDFIIDAHKSLFPIGKEFCPKPYRGDGTRVESFEDFIDWALESFDWLGDQYNALMDLAVDVLMDYTPFGLQCKAAAELAGELGADGGAAWCRTGAKLAVQAGATALGIPPHMPEFNELIDQGVDYAAELAIAEIEARTGLPCVGPCADAIRAGISHFADELKRASDMPGCVDPKTAHARGREPLCLPDTVIARPAKGATTTLPLVELRVTRTSKPVPPVRYLFDGRCTASIASIVSNDFPERSWTGPSPSTPISTPAQTVTGRLYKGRGFPLDVAMEPGETLEIAALLEPAWYAFPFYQQAWSKVQTSGSQYMGIYKGNWMTLYFGGVFHLSANIGAGGGGSISCTNHELHEEEGLSLPLPENQTY